MGLEMDVCDTELVLGFGRPTAAAAAPTRSVRTVRISGCRREPSLTLGRLSAAAVDEACGLNLRKEQSEGLQYSSCSHSTVSSHSNVKRERDADLEVERAPSSRPTEDDDGEEEEEDASAKKKLRLTKAQSALLEERFKEHSTLNPKQKQALAKQLNLRPRQVEVWFQNRRARTKLKQTEMDYEFLKRCCETLREENRKLHKEVQELKAFKFSAAAPLYMQLPPATMCPSCQRLNDNPKPAAGPPVVVVQAQKPQVYNPFAAGH